MSINSIFDYDLTGGTDTSGRIKELNGKQAFENSVLLWLTSMEGDTIREPYSGGYAYPYLMKPLSEENRDLLQDIIYDGLIEDFGVTFQINEVSVIPNYSKRKWEINISGYSQTYNTSVDLGVGINAG